jgi:hypothetical protein
MISDAEKTDLNNTLKAFEIDSRLKTSKAMTAILFIIIAGNALSFIIPNINTVLPTIGTAIIALFTLLMHHLTATRIKNGWFGTNEAESRELIAFIIKQGEKNKKEKAAKTKQKQ